jgi:hypothetical protein
MAEPVRVTITAEQRPGRREKRESMESRAKGGPANRSGGLVGIMGPRARRSTLGGPIVA